MDIQSRKPFSNCYVFSKVMQDNPNLCKEVAEHALGEKIAYVEMLEAESEESTVISRAVRFDVYLKTNNTLIAMEMQAYPEPLLPLRDRYYHSWLDRRSLSKGNDLEEMPRACVVFICMLDPADRNEPIYDVERYVKPRYSEGLEPYDDRSKTILLNAKGNFSHATPELAELLKYLATGAYEKGDNLPSRLEIAIEKAYQDEEWVSSMSILEVDRATRENRIARQARDEERNSVYAREAALLEALRSSGHEDSELTEALLQGNLDELYAQYNIE